MKTRILALALFCAVSAFAQYQYYYTFSFASNPGSLDPTHWTKNGYLLNNNQGNNNFLLTANPSGSLISSIAVPDGSSNYEVSMTLGGLPGEAGTATTFLRATSNAIEGSSPKGTFYAVDVTSTGSSCTLAINQVVNGSVTNLASTPIPCWNGMVVRTVMQGPKQMIIVWIGYIPYLFIQLPGNVIASGQPGIGGANMTGGFGIQSVSLGLLDTVAPSPLNAATTAEVAYPNHVDTRWITPPDNPGGTGAVFYNITRNSQFLVNSSGLSEYIDWAVSPSTAYTYSYMVADWHWNFSTSTTLPTATTPALGGGPPAASQGPGVRSTGTYWGAGGEQIDLQSGNLNYTIPLLKAVGRGGWGVPFALSYNSQMWRQDSGGTWPLGADVGYGVGWQLQAGSLFPYWSGGVLQFYIFTDSTGAEYRLTVNTNGIWTSQEGTYVEYDSSAQRLYFPDGSFWTMGCTSAGTEQDAGTMYPTGMQDTNGNKVSIAYQPGFGMIAGNTSARIATIADVRGSNYTFTYNADPIPHLLTITPPTTAQTGENYSFTYLGNQPFVSPFDGTMFGTTTLLQQATNTSVAETYAFTYSGNTGELGSVTLPKGGVLAWAYTSFTYQGGVTLREVQNRYLTPSPGAPQLTYAFSHDASNGVVHAETIVADPSGAAKAWFFDTVNTPTLGLLTCRQDLTSPTGNVVRQADYTWTQDPAGRPYIGTVLTTLDPGTAYQIQTETTQTLDAHGNVTQSNLYDYGNLTTPIRTYVNTYLTNSNYTSRHIWNRLVSSAVNGTSLVTNTYDQYAAPGLTNYTPALTMHGNTNYGTSFLYRGNVTTSLMPGQTRNFNYDVGGNVVSADDGHGHTAALTLDTTTNYTQPVLMTPNSNSNLASSYTYNGDIQVTSTTGPNGSTATIGYDSLGRPSTTTSPDGAVTTYAYTLNTTTATANGHFTRSTVDGLGRTVRVETGDATGTKSQTDSVYGPCGCSPLGKLIQQSQPYVPNGTPVWTTYTYDALGRTVQISAPGGSGTTTYSYQGNTTTVTDPTGKWKTYTKNAVGQMVHVSEPAPEGGTHETTYTANVLNQLTQVSMPRTGGTQTRTFNYSLTTGLLMSKSEPESGTVTYTYNTDSSLATMTDAKGQQVAYTYDTLGRTIQIARHNAPGYPDDPCQQDTITYDLGPGGTNVHGQGRMTIYQSGASGCTNGMVKETLSYTPSGHVASKGMQLNGLYGASGSVNYSGTLTANFTYNANGTLNQITYPNTYTLNGPSCASTPGPTFTYAYDTLERPAGVTDASQASWVKNISYGPANELLQMKRLIGDVYNSQTGATVPDFYTEVRTYNASLQLTRLTATADTVPGWTTYPTMDRGYIFSATQDNGQIVQQEDYVASEEVNYTYDSLRRLSLAQTTGTQWGQSFSYDGFGNLTGKQVTKGSAPSMSLSYNEATNRIATAGYQYDANGNLTAMPNETMTYDVANRLVQANSTLNGTEFYGYGAGDRRIWKNTGGMPEFTFWGPDGQKLGTYGPPSGNWCIGEKKINLYFAGQLIWNGPSNPNAQQLMGGVPGGAMVLDRMGTAVVQNGQTVSYFPYGEPRAGSGSNFETYQRDATTGFDYAQNRYYANVAGRFLTADPFAGSARGGAPQSWNRYTYVLGDPINSNDSDGLDSTQKCGATDQYINGIDQGTLSHIMSTNSNEEILAQTIYTESGHSSSADVFEEEWAITAVLMNRWQFVNHNWYLYSAPVVNGLQPILSLAGWGVQGDSIASVAENPSQFAVYRNAGGTVSLTPSAQSNLNSTLASDATSSQCFDLSVAITLGYAAWGNRNQDQLFKYKGIVLIDFNSFMSSHPSESYAIFAGSFGDANKFYGVPGSYVSTTRPPLRAHPIRPKRGQ